MKKYPVISENGNVYLVDVFPCKYYVNYYEVRVYEQYVGLFKRIKYRCINDNAFGSSPSYDFSKYNFDLVAIAKHEIKRIEDEWSAIAHYKQLKLDAEYRFEEWDGDCR